MKKRGGIKRKKRSRRNKREKNREIESKNEI